MTTRAIGEDADVFLKSEAAAGRFRGAVLRVLPGRVGQVGYTPREQALWAAPFVHLLPYAVKM